VSDQKPNERSLVLPPFHKAPEMRLDMDNIIEAEMRIHESKMVSPVTYADLEHCYNEAYRDLRRHLSTVGYQIAMAEKAIEEAKATVLLDKYPEFMAGKPKSHDNADLRKAFLIRDEHYAAALDRFNQLKAVESSLDGKIKVMENVCRYMRKKMDLILRSGLSSTDLHITQNRK
jgi:hypothetical protein